MAQSPRLSSQSLSPPRQTLSGWTDQTRAIERPGTRCPARAGSLWQSANRLTRCTAQLARCVALVDRNRIRQRGIRRRFRRHKVLASANPRGSERNDLRATCGHRLPESRSRNSQKCHPKWLATGLRAGLAISFRREFRDAAVGTTSVSRSR